MEAPLEYVRIGSFQSRGWKRIWGGVALRDSQVSIKQEVKGVIRHELKVYNGEGFVFLIVS